MTTTAAADSATGRRRSLSLRDAFLEFWRYPSPWIISALFVPALGARIAVGGFGRGDAVLAVVMFAAQPFVEWVVHIVLLHMRPREVLGRILDPLFARKHREHHADPRDTELVFLPPRILVQLVVLTLAVGWFAFPTIERGLTFVVTLGAIGLIYEWTHYLIHTDYRPKTAFYRALWKSHRLHHFKNENYWFTLTNNTPDKLLGTSPDPTEVETSPTARDLLGQG
jgi:sterol desaturase/sphingolipid hydroxylase (fatty acid hydroxylase superfamily)